jgi:threonine dehydrogenase-like Zn-dependent dehydrogenase
VGADRGCECVGYQCCDKHGKEHSNATMNELVQAVKATGSIGVVGVLFLKIQNLKRNYKRRPHGF